MKIRKPQRSYRLERRGRAIILWAKALIGEVIGQLQTDR
jgi:hypothetical protein